MGLAAIAAPELALSQDECTAITGATVTMLEAFDVKPDPRVEAVCGFVFTVGPIYATKAFLIRNRRNKERAERRNRTPPQAAPMKPARTNGAAEPVVVVGEQPIDFSVSPLGGGGSDGRE